MQQVSFTIQRVYEPDAAAMKRALCIVLGINPAPSTAAPVAPKPRVPQTRERGQTHSIEARRRRVVQGRKGRQS